MARVIYYTGQVQGVGFRATAASLARGHAVRGWVRNLANGRVELLVDGDVRDVSAFLDELRSRMAEYISDEEHGERAIDEPIEGFRVVW